MRSLVLYFCFCVCMRNVAKMNFKFWKPEIGGKNAENRNSATSLVWMCIFDSISRDALLYEVASWTAPLLRSREGLSLSRSKNAPPLQSVCASQYEHISSPTIVIRDGGGDGWWWEGDSTIVYDSYLPSSRQPFKFLPIHYYSPLLPSRQRNEMWEILKRVGRPFDGTHTHTHKFLQKR